MSLPYCTQRALLSSPRSLFLMVWCVLSALGCAKPKPDVGVRPEFKGVQVKKIVMTPFYLSSGMGLDVAQREEVKLAYERTSQAWLEEQGFEVVSVQAFQQSLTEAGMWQLYEEGLTFRHALDHYFTSGASSKGAEVVALQELRKSGALPEGALLFGEVVYQTQTRCRVFADESVSFAVVDQVGGATGSEVSCVVGHLQSSLVDTQTDQVMWSNRGLVELHVAKLTEEMMALNVARVVELVFAGDRGLLEFQR